MAMALAGQAGMPPQELAKAIIDTIPKSRQIGKMVMGKDISRQGPGSEA